MASKGFLGGLLGEIGGLARDAAREVSSGASIAVGNFIGRQTSTVRDVIAGKTRVTTMPAAPRPSAAAPVGELASAVPWVGVGALLFLVALAWRRR